MMIPPFTVTSIVLNAISQIERLMGRIESLHQPKPQPYLRKSNRVKTVQGSLSIEGNTLNLDQVTALIEGKPVIGKRDDVRAVLNAIKVYDDISRFDPFSIKALLKAHKMMMSELLPSAGKWRHTNAGILKGKDVSHVTPKADRVHPQMEDLFRFVKNQENHLLIRGCIFHYELEFIHPFEDGNGRIGRFWHTLLLCHYHPVFEYIPVESLIKENQKGYYQALEKSDRLGNSTPFLEFSLSMIGQSLSDFLGEMQPAPLTAEQRLEAARNYFSSEFFTRKDYLRYFKTMSTATASRDLKLGADKNILTKEGSKAQAKYRYRSA